jgi:hypothetical protein
VADFLVKQIDGDAFLHKTKDAAQARRLIAIAAVLDGASRAEES